MNEKMHRTVCSAEETILISLLQIRRCLGLTCQVNVDVLANSHFYECALVHRFDVVEIENCAMDGKNKGKKPNEKNKRKKENENEKKNDEENGGKSEQMR